MDITLKAQKRDITGKKTKKLRNAGNLPAVVFAPGEDSSNISVGAKDFSKVFNAAGHNTLVDIDVDGKKFKVIIEEVQYNPRNRELVHAMLKKIDLKEEIDVEVPVEIIGETDAVKIEKGVIVTPVSSIDVRCLPTEIPAKIDVDISTLKAIGESITVADIKLPKGVKLVHDEDIENILVTIAPPQKEEVEEAPTEVAPEDIPASVEKGKTEGEETEEKSE